MPDNPEPHPMSRQALSEQYERYPYPSRDPSEEKRRLIEGSPSHFDEIDHYLFAGKLRARERFDPLVAGAGTGDASIMLAEHMRRRGMAGTVTHLDLSAAALRVASRRAAARGLENIRFVQDDLAAAGSLGPFDYIDCCGVLHHLADPEPALAGLAEALSPNGGGLGLMVYGAYGRTGVYPLQSALARLGGDQPLDDRIAIARRLLKDLPHTNWFQRNPLLGDHAKGDADLVDLLLHSHDTPYTVEGLATLVDSAGLEIVTFMDPATYEPERYLSDARMIRSVGTLDPLSRAALAEELGGIHTKHCVYVRPCGLGASVADWRTASEAAIPTPRGFDPIAAAGKLKPGGSIRADYPGLRLSVSLPRLAPALFAEIDGNRTLAEIFSAVAGTPAGKELDWTGFTTVWADTYNRLNPLNKLLVRFIR